jgi:hypothetical protein
LAFLLVGLAAQLASGGRASRTASITADEPFYLMTTQSLLSDGDLNLTDDYANEEEERFWDGSVPLWKQMVPTEDGRLLSPHDPGLSLLTLPAYAVAGLEGVQRFLALLWAVAAAAMCLLAVRFGAPPWAALVASVAVGAGTPGVIYASQVYPEAPAALAFALGLLAALGPPTPFSVPSAAPPAGKRTQNGWGVVAAAIVLPWLGAKYVPLAVLVLGVYAWRHRDPEHRRHLAVLAIPLALAGMHYVWWHFHTFDGLTPYATNVVYAGEGSGEIIVSHLNQGGRSYRLYGLFLDARFGLFRWLPIAPLALWGLSRRTLVPAAAVAIQVLIGTFVSITMMGWWFPGRMLIAGLPALAVLVALGAARFPKTAVALTAYGLVIAAATAWSAHHHGIRLAVDPFDLGAPLAPSAIFPDFRAFGPRQIALSLAWGATLFAARSIARNGKADAPRRQLARLSSVLRPAD